MRSPPPRNGYCHPHLGRWSRSSYSWQQEEDCRSRGDSLGPPHRRICWPLCAVVGQPEDQEHEEIDEEVDEAEDQLGGGGGDDEEIEEEEQEGKNDEQEVDFE